MNKRLLKELQRLTTEQHNKPLLENDYLVTFDDSDLTKVYVIIKCPQDSLYKHKFIRLNFDIPHDYPHQPPKVSFVNYDGVRINPTLYEDSRVCATILNTWPSLESASKNKLEAWTSSFGIETIILTFFSFLDNKPYTLEANAPDNESYNSYVLHQGWYTCLIRYLEMKDKQPELFTTFISNYLLTNVGSIIDDLNDLNQKYPPDAYSTNCFYIGYYTINYIQIINKLIGWYNFLDYKENFEINENTEGISFNTFTNTDYMCNICFDTEQNEQTEQTEQTEQNEQTINLSCKHKFHLKCLKLHTEVNGNICSLCRTDITVENIEKINEFIILTFNWIINPETKRKVKIGSKTYKRLKQENII